MTTRLRRGLLALLAALHALALSWGVCTGDVWVLFGVAVFVALEVGFVVGVTESVRPDSRWSPHSWLAIPGPWLLGSALLFGVATDLEAWVERLRSNPVPSGAWTPFLFSVVIALAAAILGARAPKRPLERRGMRTLALLSVAAVLAVLTGTLLRRFTAIYLGAMFDLHLPLFAGGTTLVWCALPALCLTFVPAPQPGAGPTASSPDPVRFHLGTLIASLVFLTCGAGACVGDPRTRTDLGAAGLGFVGSLAVCFLAYRFVLWVIGWERAPS
ncbi:MAG: hypothetical protein HZA54_10380 [Planctomycetes bacterium]|nr:hypothetical protein [Planctomycetota bacterium]